LCSFCFIKCGSSDTNDSSGLDKTAKLSSLDNDDKLTLCNWEEELLNNAAAMTDCENTVETQDGLIAEESEICAQSESFSVECELSLREACVKSVANNICSLEESEECKTYRECKNQYVEPQNSGLCDINLTDYNRNRIYCYAMVKLVQEDGRSSYNRIFCTNIEVDYCWSWFNCNALNCEGTSDEHFIQMCKDTKMCPKAAYSIYYKSASRFLF